MAICGCCAGQPTQFQMERICEEFSCGQQGAADVKDHVAIESHQKWAKNLATQPKLSIRLIHLKTRRGLGPSEVNYFTGP